MIKRPKLDSVEALALIADGCMHNYATKYLCFKCLEDIAELIAWQAEIVWMYEDLNK